MARYIDADLLWTQMGEFYEKRAEEANMTDDRVVCVTWHDAVVLIKNAPTADVTDRKVGEWIDTGSGEECSICHEIQYGYDNFRRFCPNCGAQMDERSEDE